MPRLICSSLGAPPVMCSRALSSGAGFAAPGGSTGEGFAGGGPFGRVPPAAASRGEASVGSGVGAATLRLPAPRPGFAPVAGFDGAAAFDSAAGFDSADAGFDGAAGFDSAAGFGVVVALGSAAGLVLGFDSAFL